MRDKNYSTGLRGVLFEAQHYERMGAALWLYGWLVLRQTHQHGSVGWVLGGAPIPYREIEEETGFNRRTLERWMGTLRRHGYVETEAAPAGIIIRITKAKKFTQTGRSFAEGVRKAAEGYTRDRVATERQFHSNEETARRMGSSSIARSKPGIEQEIHRDFHSQNQAQRQTLNRTQNNEDQSPKENLSCLGQGQTRKTTTETDLRNTTQQYGPHAFLAEARRRLMRAEREEAVRRELAVGTGPEVRSS